MRNPAVIQFTEDGSPTLYTPRFQATYHSRHGAMLESQHVFLEAGWRFRVAQPLSGPLRIFEMGFGTGLNAFLTCLATEKMRVDTKYISFDLYPVEPAITDQLMYAGMEDPEVKALFRLLHHAEWEQEAAVTPHFTLLKSRQDICSASVLPPSDLIYYDAFGPGTQPELWSESVLSCLASALVPGGVLVTYCAKGDVRRCWQRAGLQVDRLPGPPGKREMLRAIKPF